MERNYAKIQWSKFLYKILMRVLHLSTGVFQKVCFTNEGISAHQFVAVYRLFLVMIV